MAKGDTNSVCGGAANVVNGIIEEYLAQTGSINANTFVEFCGSLTISNAISWDTISNSASNFELEGAVQYNDEYVVVFCTYNVNYKLAHHAVSIKISGNTAIVVNYVTYIESSNNKVQVEAVAIPESGKILLNRAEKLYLLGMSSNGNVSLLTATGTSVVSLTVKRPIYMIKLSSELFVTAYSNGDSTSTPISLHAIKLSGNTITVGKAYTMDTPQYYMYSYPIVALGANKFGLFNSDRVSENSKNTNFRAFVFAVNSDLTISQLNFQQNLFKTNTIDNGFLLNVVPIKPNKKFVALIGNTDSYSASTVTLADYLAAIIEFDNDTNSFSAGFFVKMDLNPPVGFSYARAAILFRIEPINEQRFVIQGFAGSITGNQDIRYTQLIEGYVSGKNIHFSEPLVTQESVSTNSNVCFVKCGSKLISFGGIKISSPSAYSPKYLYIITPSETKIRKANFAIDGITQTTATTTAKGKVAILKGDE